MMKKHKILMKGKIKQADISLQDSNKMLTILQVLRPNSALARPPEGAQNKLHVDSFDVRYRTDGSVEQFVSELAVQVKP